MQALATTAYQACRPRDDVHSLTANDEAIEGCHMYVTRVCYFYVLVLCFFISWACQGSSARCHELQEYL